MGDQVLAAAQKRIDADDWLHLRAWVAALAALSEADAS